MAGRTPRPWYYKAKNAWYVHLNGRTIRLGREKDEAIRQFHRLMSGDRPPTPEVAGSRSMTFADLVARYLDDLRPRVGGRTHYVADRYLRPVVRAVGRLPVGGVRRADLEVAVRGHAGWGPTTRHHVLTRLSAVLNWAVAEGLAPGNPLKGVRKPPARSRGAEALVAPEDYDRLLDAAPPYLKDVILALHDTGARPCEVLTVAARDFDADAGVWLLAAHKTAHVVGGVRIVFLTPAVAEVCRRLAGRHPSGPLFRRASGKPFPAGYYLARLFRGLCRRAGVRPVTPYGFRHSFATDALAAGVPDAQVAELLGHRGTGMLHRHYAHLGGRADVLRQAAARVRG